MRVVTSTEGSAGTRSTSTSLSKMAGADPLPMKRERASSVKPSITVGSDEEDAEPRGRGVRRLQPDAEQLEQLDVVLLRHLVEPVADLLGEVGKQLDQRDAGVAVVLVGPLRRVDRDATQQLLDDGVVAQIVELRGSDRHLRPRFQQVERVDAVVEAVGGAHDVVDVDEQQIRLVLVGRRPRRGRA